LGAVLPVLALTWGWDFGDRTYFWRLALDGIGERPLLGQGGTAWGRLYQVGEIPIAGTYSPHNQWLDVGYAAGFLGLTVFVVLLGHLLLRASHLVRAAAVILVPVLVASTLEQPWSFALNDSLTFTLLAALLCAPNPLPLEDDAAPSPDRVPFLRRSDRQEPARREQSQGMRR
jgi:O-antigen ligase